MANDATRMDQVTGMTPEGMKPKPPDQKYATVASAQSAFEKGKGEAKAAGDVKS